MGKTLLSAAIAAIFALPAFAQDVILLKNGNSVQAIVLEIDETTVRYKKFNNPDGPTYIAKKESIREITYKNGTKENFDNKPQEHLPEKTQNSVWITKAKETKFGFWIDPLGCAQFGPMVGVSYRVGSNYDIKGHVRLYSSVFPLANEPSIKYSFDIGIGFGLEYSKIFTTNRGNWHAGPMLEIAALKVYDHNYDDSSYDEIRALIAATGGYTLRFNNKLFVDFSFQAGISFNRSLQPLLYADASLKLGYEF